MIEKFPSELYENYCIIRGPEKEIRAFFLYLKNFCNKSPEVHSGWGGEITFWFYLDIKDLYLVNEFKEIYEKSL